MSSLNGVKTSYSPKPSSSSIYDHNGTAPALPLGNNPNFDVEAAKKRWKSRVSLITKALSVWTPSSNMSSFAVSSSTKTLISETSQPYNSQEEENPSKITFDEDQLAAIEAARNGESFFLTGSAGTGKSFVLKTIIKKLREDGLTVVVTASTGCAAVAIQGCTIHSACGVGLGMEPIGSLKKRATSKVFLRRLCKPDVLIIDEVSMLDSILFDKIEAMYMSARNYVDPKTGMKVPVGSAENTEDLLISKMPIQSATKRKKRRYDEINNQMSNGGNRNRSRSKPFGGLQVILCGDFFQLPPVAASDPKLKHMKQKFYAFDSEAWKRTILKTVVLRQVHRQSDRNFVGLLNELRYGIVTHSTMRVLSACRVAGAENEMTEDGHPVHYTKLFSYREQVDNENQKRLNSLSGVSVAFCAKKKIDHSSLEGLHISAVENLLKSTGGAERLVLKVGARVICSKNIDQAAGIVNGAAGTVIGFTMPKEALAQRRLAMRKELSEEELRQKLGLNNTFTMDGLFKEEVVNLDNEVFNSSWETCKTGFDGIKEIDCDYGDAMPVVAFDHGVTRAMVAESWSVFGLRGQEVAERRQIPLILGWALTIHKSQGMTLERVETDVGRAFDFGQVYVAISRAKSMQGLRLTTFVAKKVMANEQVKRFYNDSLP